MADDDEDSYTYPPDLQFGRAVAEKEEALDEGRASDDDDKDRRRPRPGNKARPARRTKR
jgi:hypothetical protein